MVNVVLPENKPLAWYLAVEEYFAEHATCPMWLFWIPPATVICGRHQDIEAEVNLAYCRDHGIEVVRRKSGGGTVYADGGNLMLSYICPSSHHEDVFADYLRMVSSVLQDLGFDAVTTSHNDILVDAHKVSGTACYALPQATIVHGTLLCDVDMQALENAITPSVEKLAKHAVKSVRQRVINLSQLQPNRDIQFYKNIFAQALCAESREISATETAEADRLWSSSRECADA